MPSIVALLLLAAKANGQQPFYGAPAPYDITGQPTIYDQQILPQMPIPLQSQAGWATSSEWSQQSGQLATFQLSPQPVGQQPIGEYNVWSGQPASFQLSPQPIGQQPIGEYDVWSGQPASFQLSPQPFGQQPIGEYNVQSGQPASFQFSPQPIGQQPIGEYSQQSGQPATYQSRQQAVGDVEQYQPPTKPLPNREQILQERDQYLKESESNAQMAIQKLEGDVANAKREFVAEQETARQQHFQDLDKHLDARKQEAVAATDSYAVRVQKQAEDLIKQTEMQSCNADRQSKLDAMADEESKCRQEFEHQIGAAYDSARQGGSISDPSGAIREARDRFDHQMQELAAKRSAMPKCSTSGVADIY